MNIEEKIKDLQDQLNALKRDVAEEPAEHKVWKPQLNQGYYAAGKDGDMTLMAWDDYESDNKIYNQGRAFPTNEEADKFLARERVTAGIS